MLCRPVTLTRWEEMKGKIGILGRVTIQINVTCWIINWKALMIHEYMIDDRWCVCWWYFIFVTDRDGLGLVDLEPTGGTGRVWLSHSPGQVSTQLRLVHTSWRSVRDLPVSLVSKFSLLIFPSHPPILSLQLNLIYNYILLSSKNTLCDCPMPWLWW